jgi:hypothetical protein
MVQQCTFTTQKQCDVSCHPTQLEHNNAQGKDKGLVSYNNNHDTIFLKNHVYHEHPNLQEMGIFSLQRVAKIQSEKQATRKKENCPPFSNHRFF